MATLSFHIDQDWLPDAVFWPAVADAFELLKGFTPVDTGFAQSNWDYDLGDGGVTFFNDTPYISFLEEGWSDQAPDGMVGPTLDRFPDILKAYYSEWASNNPDLAANLPN